MFVGVIVGVLVGVVVLVIVGVGVGVGQGYDVVHDKQSKSPSTIGYTGLVVSQMMVGEPVVGDEIL